ncbi:Glycine betaine transporter OpuD [Marinomonas aquimarina]|uniref:Glycine betaine transporter OpuD n=1 Tax=Marinomonas aquimarina TaxID=295068 RepID=A0A1A8TMA6_9GAMM|nr:BCCT family transporter [Marinomonas aquimarina]SBS34838.1 Glycine betaine transporter OpuD [Marinomonas aquimarina]
MGTKFNQSETDYVILADKGMFRDLNPSMAFFSKGLILAFLLFTMFDVDYAASTFTGMQDWIQTNLDWFYVLSMCIFLGFTFYLMCSRYGSIRLGKDAERPEFSYFTWFSMLFGAGMGVGLLFWSIAEPAYHIQSNPFLAPGTANTIEAANTAMQITFLHWGLHGWAVYVIVGLALAYFSYRHDLPLTIRSALYPIFGDKIFGWRGHVADLLAVFGTLFGVATTLGFGSGQINAGFSYLFGIEVDTTSQVIIIAVVSILATISAVSGVGKGIKILSEANMWMSIILLVVFILAGPTVFVLGFFVTNMGDYIMNFIPMGFWVDPDPKGEWQGWWTVFYWGWWIAWAPFVGMFIARVSKGRTIREFCLGVLLVPTLVTFLWMSIFGSTGMYYELFTEGGFGTGGIIAAVNEDISKPLFVVIEHLQLGWLTQVVTLIAITLIVTYFITSSDSGTLVITTLVSMGNENPPSSYRIFWGLGQGAIASVLLLAGGLKALQTASLAAGLPFAFIMFMMMYALMKSLRADFEGVQQIREIAPDNQTDRTDHYIAILNNR